MRIDNAKATESGLQTRAIEETVSDTHAWHESAAVLTAPAQTHESLTTDSSDHERVWDAFLRSEMGALFRWRARRHRRASEPMVSTSTSDVIVPFEKLEFCPPTPYGGMTSSWAAYEGDGSQSGYLIRITRGACPPHYHEFDYKLVVVSGVVTHWSEELDESDEILLGPGSYWFQPAGVVHQDTCITDEAMFYWLPQGAGQTFLV
jgi:mannose-6-phosphate isomerase-like protein (cupin superfamily)